MAIGGGGGGTKYTCAREISRRGDAKGAPNFLLELSRARVYFARPTIAIAKIRDYSQSSGISIPLTVNARGLWGRDWKNLRFHVSVRRLLQLATTARISMRRSELNNLLAAYDVWKK